VFSKQVEYIKPGSIRSFSTYDTIRGCWLASDFYEQGRLKMHSFSTLFWLEALLASATLATPTPNLQKRSFTHVVKRRVSTSPNAGTNALLKTFHKFGLKNPPNVAANTTGTTSNAAATEKGSVDANPQQNDSEYLSPVVIGGQTLNLDFDTGSSDLWVFSTKLSANTVGQHTAFNPTNSTTFKTIQGATWSISYGDGSGAEGIVGTDTVNIGGATATKQAVELATALSQSFVQDTNNDGLVGLAFSTLNTVTPQKQTTFFDTIMPQLALPVFSVNLKNDSTGTFTFGAIDNTAYTGSLTTVPVDSSSGFWQFSSPSFQVGTQKISNQGGSPAIAGRF
jgi:hypothetical protein